ncbi:hypothetical protein VNO77_34169 [Canavalia gladiata]|uniref:Uncharacterized protein n=1 Tax=Canavalia gladiata TaxID=3824 RepID=A0AAN9KG93_CANGL
MQHGKNDGCNMKLNQVFGLVVDAFPKTPKSQGNCKIISYLNGSSLWAPRLLNIRFKWLAAPDRACAWGIRLITPVKRDVVFDGGDFRPWRLFLICSVVD